MDICSLKSCSIKSRAALILNSHISVTNRIKDKPTHSHIISNLHTHTNVHITQQSRSHFPSQYPAYNDKIPLHSSDSTPNNFPNFNPFVYVIENGGWISMENSINWNYLQNKTYWNHLPFILFQSTGCGSPHNEFVGATRSIHSF